MQKTMFMPGVYRHFKGALYVAFGTINDEATRKEHITYFDVTKPTVIWNRNVSVFLDDDAPQDESNVTHQEKRFEYIGNSYEIYNCKNRIAYDLNTVLRQVTLFDSLRVLFHYVDDHFFNITGTVVRIDTEYITLNIKPENKTRDGWVRIEHCKIMEMEKFFK